ncbi:MAG: ribonuclease R [Proteobacteria bacterium]|jgi:ribonuclease R|nr:ribonuclease R [Pseudomonadota bacterium]
MKKRTLDGMIKRHPDGFGFFIPDDPEIPDAYIPRHSMKGIMTNDRVTVEIFPEGPNRFRGEIRKILERGTKTFAGVFYQMAGGSGLVKDEGKSWGTDLKVPEGLTFRAKDKDLVKVEILTYPDHVDGFQGKVSEVLGSSTDPLTDVKKVLVNNQIPHAFSKACLQEAEHFSEHVSEEDMKGRKDLRSLNFITIDGATAKDFDDAIYVESTPRGFLLYVAIADVSHYVRENSAIDRDAYERGTSVYFPNFVVPMLPEILSNGLCSLNPHLPRLALVAEMQFDFAGELLDKKFYEAVIESKARVTYGEAQEVIDGNEVAKLSHVKADILKASDLAKILMAARFKNGSLDLEIPETQVILDGTGVPIDIIKSERLFAHRLIEEMMLAANVAVAKLFHEREMDGIFRIHDVPNEEAIRTLQRYVVNFGGHAKFDSGVLQKRLSRILQQFSGKPEAIILNILTLRSMAQAKYSHSNIGHFGLGFEHYTHFTSPIRRYPDLIVHRLLKAAIQVRGYRMMSEDELQTAATMTSACEQRAVKSERQFVSIKKARFIHRHLGEEFEGIISSVTKFGVFVLLRQFEVDGLVHKENLSREDLVFDDETLSLVGKKSGVKFTIGDAIKIRVVAADTDSGQIDFELADPPKSLQRGFKYDGQNKKEYREFRDKKNRGRKEESSPKQSRKLKYLEGKEKGPRKTFERSKSSDNASAGFDPEAHLKKVMAQWKQRNGVSTSTKAPEKQSAPAGKKEDRSIFKGKSSKPKKSNQSRNSKRKGKR